MRAKITVTSADVSSIFKEAAERGIVLKNVIVADPLSVSFDIPNKDRLRLEKLLHKRGDEWRVNYPSSVGIDFHSIKKRWFLILSIILLLFLSLWLPQRILFINVSGNVNVSTRSIILAAEECGVFFGVVRDRVRSVSVKNYLLERLPGLAWACVNTNGCVAEIYVTEKPAVFSNGSVNSGPVGIRADTDGVIVSAQIKSGFPEFSIGQAVTEGQLLVSGIQKDGVLSRKVRSEAEIYALTTRRLTAFSDHVYESKVYNGNVNHNFSIIFGKKRIKILKDSSIYPDGCDKITKEYYLSLPGGYLLPFGVAVETIKHYDLAESFEEQEDNSTTIDAMERYLLKHTISGRILDKKCIFEQEGIVTVEFQCIEMIGREFSEELDFSYGKNN